jgi:hypothetical protein
VDELTEFTQLKRNSVASWVQRNPHYFKNVEDGGDRTRGRPPRRYQLTDAAAEEMHALFSGLPASQIESTSPQIDVISAFGEELEEINILLERFLIADSVERDNLEDWITEGLSDLSAREASLRDAGVILPIDMLGRYQRSRDNFETAREDASGYDDALDHELFEGIEALVAETSGGFLSGMVLHRIRSPEIGALSVLATLGLSDHLKLSEEKRRSIEKAASAIPTLTYVNSFAHCFNERILSPERTFPPLMDGVRALPQLRESEEFCLWLDDRAPHLKGTIASAAYARARMAMPRSRIRNVISVVVHAFQPRLAATEPAGITVIDVGEELRSALQESVVGALDYKNRLVVAKSASAEQSFGNRFSAAFLPEKSDVA